MPLCYIEWIKYFTDESKKGICSKTMTGHKKRDLTTYSKVGLVKLLEWGGINNTYLKHTDVHYLPKQRNHSVY